MRILGVDASTVRCGFAVVDGPLSSPTLTSHSELKFGLKTAHKARRQLAAAHIMRIAAEESPEVLVIERIRLFSAGKISLETIVKLAAMWSIICDASPVPVWTVQSNTWRRMAHGRGNTDKDYSVEWAKRTFRVDVGHDVADAIGIAVSGLRMESEGEMFREFN